LRALSQRRVQHAVDVRLESHRIDGWNPTPPLQQQARPERTTRQRSKLRDCTTVTSHRHRLSPGYSIEDLTAVVT
jgi:hypothetical protein